MGKGIEYASQIRQILEKSEPALKMSTEEEMSYKSAPGKWSKKEILGHLVDSAYNNHQRFLRAEKSDNYVFGGYDQDDWVKKNNYQSRDKNEIVGLFITVNFHLIDLISALADEVILKEKSLHNFDQICMNTLPKDNAVTLEYLINDYIFHLQHHLSQILN